MTGRRHTREQFKRYLMTGIVNTGFTYAVLLLALRWIDYLAAYTIAYASGIAIGYWLQSQFVFRVPFDWRTAARFPLICVMQYLFGTVLLWILVDSLRLRPAFAALIVVIANIPVGFLLSRLLLTQRLGGTRQGN